MIKLIQFEWIKSENSEKWSRSERRGQSVDDVTDAGDADDAFDGRPADVGGPSVHHQTTHQRSQRASPADDADDAVDARPDVRRRPSSKVRCMWRHCGRSFQCVVVSQWRRDVTDATDAGGEKNRRQTQNRSVRMLCLLVKLAHLHNWL